MGNDSNKRSLAKAISYRALIVITDAILVFFITKRADVTVLVVVLTNVMSTLMYFFHERAWSRVRWGKEALK